MYKLSISASILITSFFSFNSEATLLTKCNSCTDSQMKTQALSRAVANQEDKIIIISSSSGKVKSYEKKNRVIVDTEIPYLVDVALTSEQKQVASAFTVAFSNAQSALAQHPWVSASAFNIIRLEYPHGENIYDFLATQAVRDRVFRNVSAKAPAVYELADALNSLFSVLKVDKIEAGSFELIVELAFDNGAKVNVRFDLLTKKFMPIIGTAFDELGQRIPDNKDMFADLYKFTSIESLERFNDYAEKMRALLSIQGLVEYRNCNSSIEMTCTWNSKGSNKNMAVYSCTLQSDCK
jgi:hypothetical protein